jgi:hypothetical protein
MSFILLVYEKESTHIYQKPILTLQQHHHHHLNGFFLSLNSPFVPKIVVDTPLSSSSFLRRRLHGDEQAQERVSLV